MDIGREHGRHLAALHVGHAAMRVDHEDVDLGAPRHRVDRGRTGVTAGRADNRQVIIAPPEKLLEQQTEKLQRHILECQGGTMEKFQQPLTFIQLHQRGNRGMGKAAIGLAGQLPQPLGRDAVADEGLHHLLRQIGIWQARKSRDLFARKGWPAFGHIEPAIRSKAGEGHALEIERGRLAPGADVLHGPAG